MVTSLRRSDQLYTGECRYGDQECLVKNGTDCGATGCLYEITCESCREPLDPDQATGKETKAPGVQSMLNYVGMSMTSMHCHMLGHRQGQKYQQLSNPLHRHYLEHHNDPKQEYSARILTREQKILPLFIIEGL